MIYIMEILKLKLIVAGGRIIGLDVEHGDEGRIDIVRDIDGLVVMTSNLNFFKFERKKYQMLAGRTLKNVTSLTKKCRK
jgi:hypothetical protein